MERTARREASLKRTFIDFKQMSEFIKDPLIFEKAEGLYLWDTEGKRYFDAVGGVYVASLGHHHPRVIAAIHRQLEKLTFAPPLHGISDVALDFVDKVGSVTPGNLKYVKAFSGGSEANEAAMKFVRQYFKQTGHPGKYKFISLYLSYHGGTFAAMAASGGTRRKAKFEPHMPGFLKVFSPIQIRDMFPSWEETCRFCARMIEEVIASEDPETVAAVLVEPICNTAGIVTPTEEYFQMLRDTCTRHNVVLIFDEVITAFGRTGNMFAAQTFGVTPDIITTGKGASSGAAPLGIMIAREDMADAFLGPEEENLEFSHGHTFAGNPLSAAVGIAVIDEIIEKKLDKNARELGSYLAEKLEGLKRYGVVREVRGKGLLRGVELVKNPSTKEPFPPGKKLGSAIKKTSVKNGLIMRCDLDWFAVGPPLIVTKSNIDELYGLIEKSLVDALALVG